MTTCNQEFFIIKDVGGVICLSTNALLSSNSSPLMNIITSGTKVHMRCVNNEWIGFLSVR